MKLSIYAKKLGIQHRTAWLHFKKGLIPGAYQLKTGTIIVPDDGAESTIVKIVTYARVSSSENKDNLKSQSKRVQDFCAAKGWAVTSSIEEVGSGLNDTRPKLEKLLLDKSITRVVVEHKDRLTRFGYNYIKNLWHGEIVVINEVEEDEKDLMQDVVSIITSFTARLYGRRRSRRATEKLIEKLNNDS
jgi:predicted site-specific integrase-resolvase